MENCCIAQECTCILAMGTVPRQNWGPVYDHAKALERGTIFKELDLPFYAGGGENG